MRRAIAVSKSPRMKAILMMLMVVRETGTYPPSIRELGNGTDISSTSVVNYYLNKLDTLGLVTKTPGVARSLRITDEGIKALGLKVVAHRCPTCGQSVQEKSHRPVSRPFAVNS